MKVTKLKAENVHGYLQLDVDFFADLTFLIGLNGSGKTSALSLLMGLLTPDLAELSRIEFSMASVIATDGGRDIVVSAEKTKDELRLRLSGIDESLALSSAEQQLLGSEAIDGPKQVHAMVKGHPVFKALNELSTPMFLGLDRRFTVGGLLSDESTEKNRREIMLRTYWHEFQKIRGGPAAGLADTNYLVASRMQEIRAEQEGLDEELRRKILTRAFEYKPSSQADGEVPRRQELEQYKRHLQNVEQTAEGLRLQASEMTTTLTNFFERMAAVVNSLEHLPKRGKRGSNFVPDHAVIEWITNKNQVDRIFEHLKLLDEYRAKREELHRPIEKFLSLVNEFLHQTGKAISVTPRGELAVHRGGSTELRSIGALSSGERQLVVMLAHLALNKFLEGSGVFIIDEPELSLHLDWQERFVDAIRAANANVQLIMATHSPAIVLDRTENCRSLSRAL